jgi:hypothetical protein
MSAEPTEFLLPAELVAAYRRDGFVKVPGLLSRDEAYRYREAALVASEKFPKLSSYSIFDQNVNIWRVDETMRTLTLLPKLQSWARQLAGVPLRLWHDQILTKRPHNQAPTEFHQDQPYWPHAESRNPISAWIALGDIPVERGCMTFIPQMQHRDDLPMQNLGDPRSLFEICPEMIYEPRVTLPLHAGDVTFHHGRCPHMANANATDEARVAHAVIMMDAGTIFNGVGHVVTDPLGLAAGMPLVGDLFPAI